MAFTLIPEADVALRRDGPDLLVSWPASFTGPIQVYLNGTRAATVTTPFVRLPAPTTEADVEVGTVAVGDELTDYSASLPTIPADRVLLTWAGGSSVAANVALFKVYSSAAPGGAVSMTAPVATVKAQTTAGAAAPSYAWTSAPLAGGVWQFAVVPMDTAGNACASPGTVSVTVSAPPQPTASDSRGVRLHYAFAPSTRVATLTWLPSPS